MQSRTFSKCIGNSFVQRNAIILKQSYTKIDETVIGTLGSYINIT